MKRRIVGIPVNRLRAGIKRRLRRLGLKIDRLFLSNVGRRYAAGLYYSIFTRSFRREQRAVLAGRRQFENSKRTVGSTNSLLRRNIHRLEKGLIMRPRRDVFGLDYIRETVDKFETLANHYAKDEIEPGADFLWYRDVLNMYFAVTGSHPRIDALRERFADIISKLNDDSANLVPYAQAQRRDSGISYEQFLELCKQRKSVRWFLQKPVPRSEILKVLDVARLSPSSCNRYPFFFHVFDEPEKAKIVAALPGGTVGYAENFPVIIAIIGELRNFYGERDRHVIYVDASLAAMNVVLAAETLGLATCCINWPDIEEAERRAEKVLKLEPDQRPIMFMAMGYPDPEGMVCYSQKKAMEEIYRFNADVESPAD